MRLFVRDPGQDRRVPALTGIPDLDVVVGDVTDAAAVRGALDGCAAVVHAAARVSLVDRDAERTYAANVGGTAEVIGRAAAIGIPAAPCLEACPCSRPVPAPVTVDTPLISARSGYTRSKVAAERLVRNLQASGAPIVIVYPSGVLGPDAPDAGVTHQGLIAWMRTPPRMTSGTSIIDVRDVAAAIAGSLDGKLPARAGSSAARTRRGRKCTRQSCGSPACAAHAYRCPLRRCGWPATSVTSSSGCIPFDYPLTYEAMVIATGGAPYEDDSTRATLDLDWRPVDVTLADSIRWLAASGYIDARLAGALAG